MSFSQFKRLWKFFVLIFLLSFLLFNWNKFILIWDKIILFSNYEFISREISIFFEKIFRFEENLKRENNGQIEIKTEIKKENLIEIPKIKISAPIIVGQMEKTSLDYQKLEEKLKQGVLLYPGSKIGEKEGAVILGHSAPPGYPVKDYEDIFSNLNQLERGDRVFVYFQQIKYIYEVFEKKIFLPKDEENVLKIKDEKDSVLILLTCWPPGQTRQRLAVLTKLLK